LINQDTGEEMKFSTQTEAGKFLSISRQAVKNAYDRDSILGKLYKIKRSHKDHIDSTQNSKTDDYFPSDFPSFMNDID
jgi:hypothetical protein